MGALAPVSSWAPEDDLLLKNAVEAGASLESLAKGAVQFSRRFTFQELRDRWHSILYDPFVSVEASVGMIEFELSMSTLPFKPNKIRNDNYNSSVLGKRRYGSIRKCYYAMRRRISLDPFNSVDNSFAAPSSGNSDANGGETPSACMLQDHDSDCYRYQEQNVNTLNQDFSEALIDEVALGGRDGTSNAFSVGSHEEDSSFDPCVMHSENPDVCIERDPLSSNFSEVEELAQPEPLDLSAANLDSEPLPSFHPINRDSGSIDSEFGRSQVFSSSVSECDMPFENFGYSSPLNEVPIWKGIEGISAPTLPIDDIEKIGGDHVMKDALLDYNSDVNYTSISEDGVFLLDSKIKFEGPCDEFGAYHDTQEGYFAELSNSLLNFTNEEALMFMDDGEDVIQKSYIDGLSSLLSNSPQDGNEDHVPSISELEVSAFPDSCLTIPGSETPGITVHNCELDKNDGCITCNSEIQLFQASEPAANSQFLEYRDGNIFCAFNTEDPDIPCNDHIFPPTEMPSSPAATMLQCSPEALNPMSPSLKHTEYIDAPSERGPGLISNEPRNPKLPCASLCNMVSQMEPKMGLNNLCGDSQTKFPNGNSPQLVSRHADIASGNSRRISPVNVKTGALESRNPKTENVEVLLAMPAYYGINKCFTQVHGKTIQPEVDICSTLQNNQTKHSKVGLEDNFIPQFVADHSTSDQEEYPLGFDDELPSFSDVEAMILDMDLDPSGQDTDVRRKVSKYQQEETKKAIVRLEQGAHSYMQRAIASHRAFAILYGRHSKHFIRKPEVLLGRATEEVNVDIDLQTGRHTNRISRRQAIIVMDNGGSFYLTNLGKSPILVNNKDVLPGQNVVLVSSCLIEIRGMPFIFETNQTCVKQYLEKMTKQR